MTCMGLFREKEINGKPFLVLSFSTQTDNPYFSYITGEAAIDSGDDNDLSLHQTVGFLCPLLRIHVGIFKRLKDGYSTDVDIIPLTVSPHFSNTEGVQELLDSDNLDISICKDPVLPLYWCNNDKLDDIVCFVCKSQEVVTGVYLCVTCNGVYHKECVESPSEIKAHPYGPSLPLQLSFSAGRTDLCCICETKFEGMGYHWPNYKLSMHLDCAMKPIPMVIDHFKRHPHPLSLFPKQAYLPCDVCGLVKEFIPTYVCARCVFVVHQDCIHFPYVIRISRHHHRISFTYSLPSGKLSCGVCRKKVDYRYGAYSCNRCDGYFVHSRCALREDLWDGRELEGVPEEIEIVEDPFETIADGVILHFSHRQHHLKLEVIDVYDEDKWCQACVLPIYEGNYYSCVDDHCDFILHETCASAPRMIRHPLHAHPATLNVVAKEHYFNKGRFLCSACNRPNFGFFYEHSGDNRSFTLDLRCAAISEPFKYEGHEHPLFLSLTPEEEESAICQICHATPETSHDKCRKLSCIECDYVLCFKCATIPYKARYKHDKHFLTFRKEVASDRSGWCEACEKRIVYSGKGGFYACDDYCCTTLHVNCLLGVEPYLMRPGQTIKLSEDVHIVRNNTMSRPICHGRFQCRKRCSSRVFYKRGSLTYCSWNCSR